MKKNFMLGGILVVFMLFASCKKNGIDGVSTISYGTSFGMCAGYCEKSMVISDQKVAFSKTRRFPDDTKTCTKSLSKDEVNEISTLLRNSDFKSLPAVSGCPDCTDGGAEWIEINTNGEKYKVIFEYRNAPAKLKPLAEKLSALAASFSDCN